MKLVEPQRILPQDKWIDLVLEQFRKSEPVALPTETVYGLAAPADDAQAVARIYEIKERPTFNPLIFHVREDWDLNQWAVMNETERKLIDCFWPGPLSLLLKKRNVSDLVTAGSDFVVMRAPRHELFREVLSAWGAPLVAPSANSSTKLSPTTATAVLDDLGAKGVSVVDGGMCEFGLESTILKVVDGKLQLLREGAISREDLKDFEFTETTSDVPLTPGTQLKHYAPSVPLFLFDSIEKWQQPTSHREACWIKVLKSDGPDFIQGLRVECLAPDNRYKTAAAALFEFLRTGQKNYSELRVLKTQDISLGRAINDRLLRASQR